jgi:hypothetical protein
VKAEKLILTGTPEDAERLEKFCQRLSAAEFTASGRLRALAAKLARQQELDVSFTAYEQVSVITYEDEALEIEVVIAGDQFREPVTINRDKTGDRCQVSWQRWADIGDDAQVEKTAQMIAAISATCAATF